MYMDIVTFKPCIWKAREEEGGEEEEMEKGGWTHYSLS